jgi:hypothetical protein
MAESVARALLATTSLVFDSSDELNDETRKLARAAAARRAPADAAEIKRLAAAGVPTAALAALRDGDGGGPLARALADARAAAEGVAALQADRDRVVDARREAIAAREAALATAREAVAGELRAAAACVSLCTRARAVSAARERDELTPLPAPHPPVDPRPLPSATDADYLAQLRAIVATHAGATAEGTSSL